MQAEKAPADIMCDERCPQLVSQAEWGQNLSVPPALLQLMVRPLIQTADWLYISCQPGKLVHVVLEKLVLDELRRRLCEHVVGCDAGEEQGRRISRREKVHIEGEHLPQLLD